MDFAAGFAAGFAVAVLLGEEGRLDAVALAGGVPLALAAGFALAVGAGFALALGLEVVGFALAAGLVVALAAEVVFWGEEAMVSVVVWYNEHAAWMLCYARLYATSTVLLTFQEKIGPMTK